MIRHSTKRTLQQILDICIQKNIQFTLYPHVFSVSVYRRDERFEAYYFGELFNNENIVDDKTLLLSDLLKKVKSL